MTDLQISLTPSQARALSDAHHHLADRGVDPDSHPIFSALQRVATAYASEFPEEAEEPAWWGA